MAMAA